MEDRAGLNAPLLVYDGACGYCRRWVHRWMRVTGQGVAYVPFQEVGERFPEVPPSAFSEAVHYLEPDGRMTRGAEAVFRLLAQQAKRSWPLALYEHVPGFAWCSESCYRFVAGHRQGMSRLTNLLWGSDPGPSSYLLTRWLFIRLVAVVYLIAFVSLAVQIRGLIGSQGILPASEFLEMVHGRLGSEAYRRLPTLFWLDCSDRSLVRACWTGAALSILVFFRVLPALCLVFLWAFYLSLLHVGQTFLSFQWDLLLLETGFLAIFFSAWNLRPRLATEPAPPRLAVWLVWWLLFRLMFASGIVKLLDDSPVNRAWHKLTALNYHYETQCIPNALAWYAHQLPEWFQKLSVAAMFAIEIGVPFMIFLPRRLRLAAFFPLVLLQVLIILTGNYNFFNLLTLALCVSLLDDSFLRRFFPKRMRDAALAAPRRKAPWVQRWTTLAVGVVILAISALWMGHTLRPDRSERWTAYLERLHPRGDGLAAKTAGYAVNAAARLSDVTRPFASVNTYGLFRHMTITRPEIIIEGSRDGHTWLPYEFKWKPGDLSRRPSQAAPHQPRLDWQMWFAALGRYQNNPWFVRLMQRLLEGRQEVLLLLESNPFGDEPPKYIRATLYDYHFSTWEERRRSGAWWRREELRSYFPTVTLGSFQRR